MTSRLAQMFVAAAVLLLAAAVGWLMTNRVQQSVPLAPGIEGCSRLEGMARQTECLSREFVTGGDAAAGNATEADRDRAIIEFVRRAERLAAADADLAGMCHPAMHRLGQNEGKRAAAESRTPQFPSGSSQLCTAGYVHGLAEGYLVSSPTADIAAVFPKLCHDESAREGCAHGIGHAVLKAQRASKWAVAAPNAIERCAELPATVATNCENGVYMELAMRTDPSPVPPDQYTAICREAKSADQELACWGYLRTNLTTNDVSLDAVSRWCAKADLPAQYPCIEGYGRDLGADRVARCADASPSRSLQKRCVEGAIGLQVGSGHVTGVEARRHCRSVRPASLKHHCRNAVDRYLNGRARVEAQR